MTVRTGLFMGMAGAALLSTQAMALDVQDGLNTLSGRAFGLDENYIGAPGDYVMPDGSTSGPAGTPGMTESLRPEGVNLPQPASLPGSDIRSDDPNPNLGGLPRHGARTGAVIGWNEINFQNLLVGGPNPFNVTGVAYNLTPQQFLSVSGPLVDDGSAPGSVAADGIPDFLAFSGVPGVTRRVASITLQFFGPEDAALFGGSTPTDLIGRLDLYEGGALAGFGPIPPGTALEESDFNHNTGELVDSLAAFDDGTLLLTGQITDAEATLTWEETAVGSGQYVLSIGFQGTAVYDGGTLFSSIENSPEQTISANWNGIPFPVGTGGLDFNGNDVFDFRGGAGGIGGSFSSDQSFNVGEVIPEPVTAGLGGMALASLGAYITRRRRA